jgi:hypothetical protein
MLVTGTEHIPLMDAIFLILNTPIIESAPRDHLWPHAPAPLSRMSIIVMLLSCVAIFICTGSIGAPTPLSLACSVNVNSDIPEISRCGTKCRDSCIARSDCTSRASSLIFKTNNFQDLPK